MTNRTGAHTSRPCLHFGPQPLPKPTSNCGRCRKPPAAPLLLSAMKKDITVFRKWLHPSSCCWSSPLYTCADVFRGPQPWASPSVHVSRTGTLRTVARGAKNPPKGPPRRKEPSPTPPLSHGPKPHFSTVTSPATATTGNNCHRRQQRDAAALGTHHTFSLFPPLNLPKTLPTTADCRSEARVVSLLLVVLRYSNYGPYYLGL